MKKGWNDVKFLILACVFILGIATSFSIGQMVWLAIASYRVETYAASILKRAEEVSQSFNGALDDLNGAQLPLCGSEDKWLQKKVTYEFRFIEDAGRVINNSIYCSVMRNGSIGAYQLKNPPEAMKDGTLAWKEKDNYLFSKIAMPIFAKKNAFVVISPHAFSAYENPPTGLSGEINPIDNHFLLQSFGYSKHKNENGLLSRTAEFCSKQYNMCATGNMDVNIFEASSSSILMLLFVLGCALGGGTYLLLEHLHAKKSQIDVRLAKAVKDDSISVAFQPIVTAKTGEIQGFEVLARWNDKRLGPVSPEIFFKEAKNLKISTALSQRIINKALFQLSPILKDKKHIYISINLDAQEILEFSLINHIDIISQKYGIDSHQIAIEILEGSTADILKIEERIKKIRNIGHNVFIDDFGSGYSSLSYLSRINVDKIKIDKSFTKAAGTESPAAFILKKVCEIAKSLGANVIFEGVETEAQRQAILSFCPDALAQGWLFSKAMPIEEIQGMLLKQSLLPHPSLRMP